MNLLCVQCIFKLVQLFLRNDSESEEMSAWNLWLRATQGAWPALPTTGTTISERDVEKHGKA